MDTSDPQIRVVMLCTDGLSSRIVFNHLAGSGFDVRAIIECKESATTFFRRRLRKLGWFVTAGQVAYLVVAKLQRQFFEKRVAKVLQDCQLSGEAIPAERIEHVESVNLPASLEKMKRYAPQIIVVNGTRILSKNLINSASVPIINTHLGITPKYRGVYGGYWARVAGDEANVGATIHRVDAGIDTGSILKQAWVEPEKLGHSCLLPIIQLCKIVRDMPELIRAVVVGSVTNQSTGGESRLWYHPTLWQYFWYGISKGIW
jgi:phosphoribosylglycinamide formyltransferase-1